MTASPLRVAVLAGGDNAERDVSLMSVKSVMAALNRLGHEAQQFDVTPSLATALHQFKPDVVFNALHGTGGEDGIVQGFLEVLGLPYTHSGARASAIAMDKVLTKHALSDTDIDVAAHVMVSLEDLTAGDPLPRPFVVKPVAEGSSVAVVIVTGNSHPSPITADVEPSWGNYDQLMAEAYIPGQELSVAVLGDRALGVIELRPRQGFYDYASKYTDGMTDHIMPAEVPQDIHDRAMRQAKGAHRVLGCRGITRSDFRYDADTGRLVFLEINTQPGMTELSLVPEIAAHAGISFDALIDAIIQDTGVRP